MNMNSLVTIGGSCLSTLILWQTLFEAQASKLVLLLRVVLFAFEALTGIAMARTHPKATSFDNLSPFSQSGFFFCHISFLRSYLLARENDPLSNRECCQTLERSTLQASLR